MGSSAPQKDQPHRPSTLTSSIGRARGANCPKVGTYLKRFQPTRLQMSYRHSRISQAHLTRNGLQGQSAPQHRNPCISSHRILPHNFNKVLASTMEIYERPPSLQPISYLWIMQEARGLPLSLLPLSCLHLPTFPIFLQPRLQLLWSAIAWCAHFLGVIMHLSQENPKRPVCHGTCEIIAKNSSVELETARPSFDGRTTGESI